MTSLRWKVGNTEGIINNAKTKIILNLEDDEAMRVQDALKLTERGRFPISPALSEEWTDLHQ